MRSILAVVLMLVLLTCTVMFVVCKEYYIRLPMSVIIRMVRASQESQSFDIWSKSVRTFTYIIHKAPYHPVPPDPHFVLLNHVRRGRLDSFRAAAAVAPVNSTIIAYSSYSSYLPLLSTYIERVLKQDIRIDQAWSPEKKEACIVQSARSAFTRGQNVIMFIDAHDRHKPMRGLNQAVLNHFPERHKYLIHLSNDATRTDTFLAETYPPTCDIEQIITWRQTIIHSRRER